VRTSVASQVGNGLFELPVSVRRHSCASDCELLETGELRE
jgi:hypothetical protein